LEDPVLWSLGLLGFTDLITTGTFYPKVNLCVANSKSCHAGTDCYDGGTMRDLAILFNHLLTTIAKLIRPGGGRAALADLCYSSTN
jgi:hypothetical protein